MTEWQKALMQELLQWRGRKHVQCWEFVAGVMDSLHGVSSPLPFIPFDLAMNSPKAANRATAKLLRRYPPSLEVRVDGYVPEPGDVLMLKQITKKGIGVGHTMIVGDDTRAVWHVDSACIWFTSFSVYAPKILRVYRSSVRERWLCSS
jgi:hypothetical protein